MRLPEPTAFMNIVASTSAPRTNVWMTASNAPISLPSAPAMILKSVFSNQEAAQAALNIIALMTVLIVMCENPNVHARIRKTVSCVVAHVLGVPIMNVYHLASQQPLEVAFLFHDYVCR